MRDKADEQFRMGKSLFGLLMLISIVTPNSAIAQYKKHMLPSFTARTDVEAHRLYIVVGKV